MARGGAVDFRAAGRRAGVPPTTRPLRRARAEKVARRQPVVRVLPGGALDEISRATAGAEFGVNELEKGGQRERVEPPGGVIRPAGPPVHRARPRLLQLFKRFLNRSPLVERPRSPGWSPARLALDFGRRSIDGEPHPPVADATSNSGAAQSSGRVIRAELTIRQAEHGFVSVPAGMGSTALRWPGKMQAKEWR